MAKVVWKRTIVPNWLRKHTKKLKNEEFGLFCEKTAGQKAWEELGRLDDQKELLILELDRHGASLRLIDIKEREAYLAKELKHTRVIRKYLESSIVREDERNYILRES